MSKHTSAAAVPDSAWSTLYKAAAICALIIVVMIPIQSTIYIVFPPPATVEAVFARFQQSPLMGLLDFDLLYIIDNSLLIVVYLGLFTALKKSSPSLATIGLALGLVGVAAYYSSTIAVEMLTLSGRYAAAAGEVQRAALLGAGELLLATYKGTAFDVYYFLNGITLLIFSAVMLRGSVFSRRTGIWGLVSGVLMAVPSNFGTVGMAFAFASLVPWAVFSVLIALRMWRLAQGK